MPETTEWRAWGESWLAALLPALLALGGVVLASQGLDSGDRLGGAVVVIGLLFAALGAFGLVLLYRTRTRLTDAGIEIRQARPEVIPWTEITAVQLDPNRGLRTIAVSTRDGHTRTLPTPTQGKRPPSDPTMSDAVAAMRRRIGP